MSILQIFLLGNAFVLGVVITLAVQYGLAHRRHQRAATKQVTQNNPISPAVKERIAKQAEANFQGIVNRSALQLQHDLGASSAQLTKLLEKFGSDVLDDEMKLFRTNVADIRATTQESLAAAQDKIGTQQTEILTSLSQRQADLEAKLSAKQAELEAELEQSMAAEKQVIAERLHTKMNDAVLAFLLETLGHEVDLGAQADYLVHTLEANKAELLASAGVSAPKKVEVK